MVKIKHIDGVTDVFAKPFVTDSRELILSYKFESMDYSITLTLPHAINMGIITKVKATNSFRNMVKGEVYKVLGVQFSEDDFICAKGDMCISVVKGEYMHFSNFYPAI